MGSKVWSGVLRHPKRIMMASILVPSPLGRGPDDLAATTAEDHMGVLRGLGGVIRLGGGNTVPHLLPDERSGLVVILGVAASHWNLLVDLLRRRGRL